MTAISIHLKETMSTALPLLRKIGEKEASFKADAKRWSFKEIIGHLIDSASNNHQKFIRTMERDKLDFVPYKQDNWVRLQQYKSYDWMELLELFEVYNKHIAHVMKYTRPSVLEHKITIDGAGPFTLEFIMSDYVEHLRHHLKAILPNAGIASKFENIYNS
jgi:hypothetical protein